MDGAGHALDGLQVPLQDPQFFTVFFEVDVRMRKVLLHHRVHAQAALCDVSVRTKDRAPSLSLVILEPRVIQ